MMLITAFAFGLWHSQIKSDEHVVLFPTMAVNTADGNWILPIHGWIYEPEADSIRRNLALESFRKMLGLEQSDSESKLFRQRAALFLVDNERGKSFEVRIGEEKVKVGPSENNGHFRGEVKLTQTRFDALRKTSRFRDGWLHYELVAADGRRFTGRICLQHDRNWIVVSDLDDTLKVSDVRDKKKLLTNTFLKDFTVVPGMSDLLKQVTDRPANHFYVTATPWQMFDPIRNFCEKNDFPAGVWVMKDFRWKDTSFFHLFQSPEEYKLQAIEPILLHHPKHSFVLIGDSGERDPEAYGALARRFPAQVKRILIRNVTNESKTAARYKQAFAGVDSQVWDVFEETKQISNLPVKNVEMP